MERYKAIRQLMAEGEFRKALDHLVRILQKNPEDAEAVQLEYTCREMIRIQNACEDDPDQKNEISVKEYVSVHFRRIMKKLCGTCWVFLNKLPIKWQQKLKIEHFKVWEVHFSVDTDAQKDWLWELLFWDSKRRITVFTALITALLLGIVLFFLLVWNNQSHNAAIESSEKDFSTIVKSAYAGNADAQFLLGKSFYYGQNVERNVDAALEWLTKAARSGHPEAAKLLQKISVEQDITVHNSQYLWEQPSKESRRDFQ